MKYTKEMELHDLDAALENAIREYNGLLSFVSTLTSMHSEVGIRLAIHNCNKLTEAAIRVEELYRIRKAMVSR